MFELIKIILVLAIPLVQPPVRPVATEQFIVEANKEQLVEKPVVVPIKSQRYQPKPIPVSKDARTQKDHRRLRASWLIRHSMAVVDKSGEDVPEVKEYIKKSAYLDDGIFGESKFSEFADKGKLLYEKYPQHKILKFWYAKNLAHAYKVDEAIKALTEVEKDMKSWPSSLKYMRGYLIRQTLVLNNKSRKAIDLRKKNHELLVKALKAGEFLVLKEDQILFREYNISCNQWSRLKTALVKLRPKDDWLVLTVSGLCETFAANSRNTGINKRTAHRKNSYRLLKEAWLKHKDRPEPAALLIKLVRDYTVEGDTPRMWFDRACAAEFDFFLQYTYYFDFLLYQGDRDPEKLLVFGTECLDTNRFDTEVPARFFHAITKYWKRSGFRDWRIPFRNPDNIKKLDKYFQGYIAEPSRETQRSDFRKQYALAKLWTCRYQEAAAELIDVSETEKIFDRRFSLCLPITYFVKMDKKMIMAEIEAFTGKHAKELLEADKLVCQQKYNEAIVAFEAVLGKIEDKKGAVYSIIRRRAGLLRLNTNWNSTCFKYIPTISIAYYAAHKQDIETLKWLGAHGADMNERQSSESLPIITAINSGSCWRSSQNKVKMKKTVSLLVELGADINAKDSNECTALSIATHRQNISLVKYLLGKGGDLNTTTKGDIDLLYLAVKRNDIELAKLFIDKGIDINHKAVRNWTAFLRAAKDGNSPMINLLIDNGVDTTVTTSTKWGALHLAAEKGHTDVIKILLKKGLDIEARNSSGETPLFVAANMKHEQAALLILSKGADVNVSNKAKYNIICLATKNKLNKLVKALIEAKVDVNMPTKGNYPPIQHAAMSRNVEAAKLLLEAECEVNALNDWKYSALHMAARRGHTEMVKLLLDYGIDPYQKTQWKKTPFDLTKSSHTETRKLLKEAMGE